jgi:membrane associated rhomboid family serine protease
MLIPLGTDRPLKRPTLITYWLIGINVVIFLAQLIISQQAPQTFERLLSSLWLDPRDLSPWGFLSYQFLHGDFLHLLGNMVFLYVFGPNVEDRLRRVGFLAFYLLAGVAAGGAHLLATEAPVIGASGAIAGLTGAYFVLFPRTLIKTLVFFFIIGVFEIPAMWFIGFAIAKDIVLQGFGADTGVAYLAHIGGYAFGIGVSLALLAAGLLSKEPYDLFSLGRQAHRRRRFKELTSRGASPWTGDASASPAAKGRHPEKASPHDEEIAERRRKIQTLLSQGQHQKAAEAYQSLLKDHGEVAMGRRAQLDVANALFEKAAHLDAARAYAMFLDRHEHDPEAPRIRLMLGLLYARYLARPDRARALVEAARPELHDEAQKQLADALLHELPSEAAS